MLGILAYKHALTHAFVGEIIFSYINLITLLGILVIEKCSNPKL